MLQNKSAGGIFSKIRHIYGSGTVQNFLFGGGVVLFGKNSCKKPNPPPLGVSLNFWYHPPQSLLQKWVPPHGARSFSVQQGGNFAKLAGELCKRGILPHFFFSVCQKWISPPQQKYQSPSLTRNSEQSLKAFSSKLYQICDHRFKDFLAITEINLHRNNLGFNKKKFYLLSLEVLK